MKTRVQHFNRFKQLSQDKLDWLNKKATELRLEKGSVIFSEGEKYRHCYAIRSGYIKILKSNVEGQDVFVAMAGPQDCIGEFGILNHMKYPITAVCATDAVFLVFSASDLVDLSKCSPDFVESTAQELFRRFNQLNERVANLAWGDARSRTLSFFLILARRFGRKESDGSTVIPFLLERSELADAINVRTETAIRMMGKLKKENLLVTTKDGYRLQPELLSAQTYSAKHY